MIIETLAPRRVGISVVQSIAIFACFFGLFSLTASGADLS